MAGGVSRGGPDWNQANTKQPVGALCAAFTTYLAVRFPLEYFESNRLTPFGVYCLAAGIVITTVLALGG